MATKKLRATQFLLNKGNERFGGERPYKSNQTLNKYNDKSTMRRTEYDRSKKKTSLALGDEETSVPAWTNSRHTIKTSRR